MGTINVNDEMLVYRQADNKTYKTSVLDISQLSLSRATVAPVPPLNPTQGNLWFDSTKGSLFIYYEDPDTQQWTDTFAGALPSSLVASGGTHERPPNPSVGDLFLDTDLNTMLYWDGTSWVILGGGTGGGANVYTSFQPPDPSVSSSGDLWYNTSDGRLYLYLRDVGGSLQWIDASPDSQTEPEFKRDAATNVVSTVHYGDTLSLDNEIHLGRVGTNEASINFAAPRHGGTPLIDLHNQLGFTNNNFVIQIREGNEINYAVSANGSVKIGGSVPTAPNIEFDADLGTAVFQGTVQAANINLPFTAGAANVIEKIENLISTIDDLTTRVAALEGN